MDVGLVKGRTVGGRYRLDSLLGQGGMAVVWRAEHTETGRAVALKIVRSELAVHDGVREMFVREARIAARIGKSEHIVDVLDAGVDPELGLPFLAMELLSGETLDALLQRAGPPGLQDAILVLEQLADALDQAHAAGVIHRDLKPQNLFLTRDRRGQLSLKVLDFGIAKAAETVQSSATQVGTPAYAAPEQLGDSWRTIAARGGRTVAAQVSTATDVWAYGLVAYELFTGAPSGQFWGASTLAELPAKIFLEALPSAALRAGPRQDRLPPGFDAWLARCLDLDASRRFPSAGGAIAALRSAMGDSAARASYPPASTAQATPLAQPPLQHATPSGAASTLSAAATFPGATPTTGAGPTTTLAAWAASKHMQLQEGGDLNAYVNWMQFQFVPPLHQVVREGRVTLGDANALIGELVIHDEVRRAVGEAHMLVAIVGCPRLHHNVAVRAKKLTGIGEGISRGLRALDQLVSSKPKEPPVLGDSWFESKFEVKAPSPQEAHAALPVGLRQYLMNTGFAGILETRPGRMTLTQEPARFDPPSVERLLSTLSSLLACFP
ncbi:MAG: serine/threonine-protein kinase [Polyangiaceae bacterium]